MVHPTTNRLVGHSHSTFCQQIFDVAQAEREPEVVPNGLLNDLGREPVTRVADFLHPLGYRAASGTASAALRDNAEGVAVSELRPRDRTIHQAVANAYAIVRSRSDDRQHDQERKPHVSGDMLAVTNGGRLEKTAHMVNHASMRTTQFKDRHAERVTLDWVGRIGI